MVKNMFARVYGSSETSNLLVTDVKLTDVIDRSYIFKSMYGFRSIISVDFISKDDKSKVTETQFSVNLKAGKWVITSPDGKTVKSFDRSKTKRPSGEGKTVIDLRCDFQVILTSLGKTLGYSVKDDSAVNARVKSLNEQIAVLNDDVTKLTAMISTDGLPDAVKVTLQSLLTEKSNQLTDVKSKLVKVNEKK